MLVHLGHEFPLLHFFAWWLSLPQLKQAFESSKHSPLWGLPHFAQFGETCVPKPSWGFGLDPLSLLNLGGVISLISIAIFHSLDTKSDTPDMNLLILALGYTTINGAYLESLVNLKEYSLILMFPCLRFMNSCTLVSNEKNLSKNAILNSSYPTRSACTPFSSTHWSYQTFSTPFN